MNTVSDYTAVIDYANKVAEQIYVKLTEEQILKEVSDDIEILLEIIRNLNSQVVNLSAELDSIAVNSGDIYDNYEGEDGVI